ncbi:MAG: nucleoside 2-deoxyribosyltransferase [Candidatus Scalindua sp.]|nr:nucleoside 2-deoxyribosyltransferase [Candidatus Scalindua sp.]
MNTENKVCPFCGIEAQIYKNPDTLETTYSNCLCGKFTIERRALDDKEFLKILTTDEKKILFSGFLRNNQSITLTSEFIGKELPQILEYCQTIPLSEKISKIKSYLYQKTSSIGKSLVVEYRNLYTLFYLKNYSELIKLLTYLQETKILQKRDHGKIGDDSNECVMLTVEGFSEIESALRNNIQSKKVFIACDFKTDFQDDLVNTIKAACASCGFEANLVSDERHNNDISHKIISDIKQSKFIIADFTDQNNGVYFEAGFAMGESKEVIRLIKKDQLKELHFDIRQFNHITWEMDKWEELKEDLINQIKATIKL